MFVTNDERLAAVYAQGVRQISALRNWRELVGCRARVRRQWLANGVVREIEGDSL